MIRKMSNDDDLMKKLKAKNNIKFIASELIFEQGNYRVDIVGYDGIDLYLFELKKGRTTKVDQVKKYVDYYSEPDKRKTLEDLLSNYPISPVKSFDKIKGVMIMQYAENSYYSKKWCEFEKKNTIKILFFEKYLAYKTVKKQKDLQQNN